jgi:hypothetical protein
MEDKKIQMTLGLKSQPNTQEQVVEKKQTDEANVEPIETKNEAEAEEAVVNISAFQKLHHWIYAKFHRKDGRVKGWLMGIVLGVTLALVVIAIRMSAAR